MLNFWQPYLISAYLEEDISEHGVAEYRLFDGVDVTDTDNWEVNLSPTLHLINYIYLFLNYFLLLLLFYTFYF